jgi:hypothetical protein
MFVELDQAMHFAGHQLLAASSARREKASCVEKLKTPAIVALIGRVEFRRDIE